jgi:hypothetical protein
MGIALPTVLHRNGWFEMKIFPGKAAPSIAARCGLCAARRGCEPTDHYKSEKDRSIEAIKPTI